MAKISVISLGGTIAMGRTGGAGGVVPSLSGEELAAAVPGLAAVAQVSATSFRQVPGAHLTFDDLVALAREIERQIDAGAQGIVVTQGTDTIEESAFALDLLVDRPQPVVVTGAMRNPTLPGADGPANILAAVQVAAGPEAQGLGALVVFNDEIHAARYVRKTHSSSTATFRSPLTGPVGWVAEGRVRIAMRPPQPERFRHVQCEDGQPDRPVALLTVSLGDDGRLLPLLREAGYQGVVMEAFGVGHLPAGVAEGLGELAREMPVVYASRTGSGETFRSTYGFPGSESDLVARGLIPAGRLDGPKARVLLSLLLRSGAGRDDIEDAFVAWDES